MACLRSEGGVGGFSGNCEKHPISSPSASYGARIDQHVYLSCRSFSVGGTKRKADKNTWKVSIKEIQERNYNLDFKNPNGNAKPAHKDPKDVLETIAGAEKEIAKILEEVRKEI